MTSPGHQSRKLSTSYSQTLGSGTGENPEDTGLWLASRHFAPGVNLLSLTQLSVEVVLFSELKQDEYKLLSHILDKTQCLP